MKKNLYFIIFVLVFIFSFKISASPIEQNKIGVDIKGAIKYPGYYLVDYNSTIYDVIKQSGGLLSNADTSIINLSKQVSNEDAIIIYTIDEIEQMKEGNTSVKIIEKECMCPKIDSIGCIEKSIKVIGDSYECVVNIKREYYDTQISEEENSDTKG